MKRHLSHGCRLFAFFLVFLMALAPMMTPAAAVAEAETSASERETESPSGVLPGDLPEWETEPNPDYIPGVEAFRAMEIPTRRERYVKHFALGGGEYQAVVYGDAVHRLNADGTWRDIDNRLLSDGAGRFATPDGRVSVAGNTGRSDFLLSIEEDGYYIAMTPYDSGAVTAVPGLAGELLDSAAEIVNHPERVTADTDDLDALMTVNNTTCVTYSSVYRATDLEYILTGDTIKENIIVNAPADSYTYVFRIRLSGLYPVLSETGEIRLLDEGTDEERYVMPAPFMYDADGDYSDEVSYRIMETEEAGQYLLAVVADENWFSERDRAFPVTIDPSLTKNCGSGTYIDSLNPTKSYGGADSLCISDTTIAFLSVSLPTLPSNAQLKTADLVVYSHYGVLPFTSNVLTGVYRVNKAWKPVLLTWNSASKNDNMGLDTECITTVSLPGRTGVSSNYPAEVHIDIRQAVASWYAGSSNYGIAFRYISGDGQAYIIHPNTSTTSHRPHLTVSYSVPVVNGVYYLKSSACGKYLDTKDGGYTDGSTLQAWTKTDGVNRNQLYKITYAGAIGDNNVYTIRPMTNCELGLYYDETESKGEENSIFLKKMLSAYDQTVFQKRQDGYLWILTENSGTYTIKNLSTVPTDYLCMAAASGNGTPVISSGGGTNTARWVLEIFTEELKGFEWRAGNGRLIVGESAVYIGVVYDSAAGRNGPVTCYITDENGNTTDRAEYNPTTGELIAKKVGEVKVWATFPGAQEIYVLDLKVFEAVEGVFYIKNVHTSTYLQIDNDVAPNYNTNQAHMELFSLDKGLYQRWRLVYVGNGYYKIGSAMSDMALSVRADKLDKADYSLIQESYDELERQQWEITKGSSGNYEFRPRSGMNSETDWTMAAGTGLGSNGINVEQRKYSASDNRCQWELKSSYAFAFYGKHLDDPAMPPILTSVEQAFDSTGQFIGEGSVTYSNGDFLAQMRSNTIFACITHGSQTSLQGSSILPITIDDIKSMSDSAFEGLSLVYYGACLTGLGGDDEENLVNATYEKGAKIVIGFSRKVDIEQTNYWSERFLQYIANGESVQSALNQAGKDVKLEFKNEEITVNQPYVKGDTSLILCPKEK